MRIKLRKTRYHKRCPPANIAENFQENLYIFFQNRKSSWSVQINPKLIIVKKQLTLATKDWLLTPISNKPWNMYLRQATLNIQRIASGQSTGKSIQLVPPPDTMLTDGWKVKNPTGRSLEESPKTITGSRMNMEEGGMNVPTGSLSNNMIKEQDQPSKMILFPEDGILQRPLRLLGWRSGEPRSLTTFQEGRDLKIDTKLPLCILGTSLMSKKHQDSSQELPASS
jgi:hypothetical protein